MEGGEEKERDYVCVGGKYVEKLYVSATFSLKYSHFLIILVAIHQQSPQQKDRNQSGHGGPSSLVVAPSLRTTLSPIKISHNLYIHIHTQRHEVHLNQIS